MRKLTDSYKLYWACCKERTKLQRLERAFLSASGWHYSCMYPDSNWRWEKHIEGKGLVAASESEAIRMEENLCEAEDLA
jgi:hypothetical protein